MKLRAMLFELKNYKNNLVNTALWLEKNKLASDDVRSIDDTIGYLNKKKIKCKYRGIKR